MSEGEKFTHTPELVKLQEVMTAAIEAYARAVEARRVELGIVDLADPDYQSLDGMFMSGSLGICQFVDPSDDDEMPVIAYGLSRGTTPALAVGMCSTFMGWF